jgi:hypothetical protein
MNGCNGCATRKGIILTVSRAVRPPGFILFTDLPKAGPYLAAIAARALRALVITGPPHWPLEHVAASFFGKPGHPFSSADMLEFFSPDDHAGILGQATAWAREYDVQGIFASSETFVEAAGQAADLLGLRGPGLRAARVCRNKHLQRLYLSAWSPGFVLSGAPADAVRAAVADWYPLISKPLDLYCSIGVKVIRDPRALETHLSTLDPGSPVLLEQCVTGREFSVETIVTAGQPVFSAVTQKTTADDAGDYFVEMEHTAPAANLTLDEAARLKATQAAILARLEFGTGMVHGEYRIQPDGGIRLMEIAARPAGDGILHLYHLATGASMESSIVDAVLGLPTVHPEPSRWARQVYFAPGPGKLDDVSIRRGISADEPQWLIEQGLWPPIEPVAPNAPPGLRKVLALKERGAELGPLTDSFGRAVTVLFDAPDLEQLESFDKEARAAVNISIN